MSPIFLVFLPLLVLGVYFAAYFANRVTRPPDPKWPYYTDFVKNIVVYDEIIGELDAYKKYLERSPERQEELRSKMDALGDSLKEMDRLLESMPHTEGFKELRESATQIRNSCKKVLDHASLLHQKG